MTKTADISACGRYRFTLTREWDASLPWVAFIGVNPSVADADIDDPTIRREINFAKAWGFGRLLKMNLYAYRTPYTSELWKAQKRGVDIIGGERNYFDGINATLAKYECARVIAAWGKNGKSRGQEAAVRISYQLDCLRINGDGSPEHTLFLPGDLTPIPFNYSPNLATADLPPQDRPKKELAGAEEAL